MKKTIFLTSKKGISLPIAVGLVTLLMVAATAANHLVIRNINSIHQIEAASKAYLVAEAGIEDALYELSSHFAGYETHALNYEIDSHIRQSEFDTNWKNRWAIQNHNLSINCNGQLCGTFNQKRRLVISLFNDKGTLADGDNTKGVINANPAAIKTMGITQFAITFSVPPDLVNEHQVAFSSGLIIDNDGDAWITALNNGINEDDDWNEGNCVGVNPTNDADCDGKENEDSPEDLVINWKITDGIGNILSAKKGCLNEIDPTKPQGGSEICEKNFFDIVGNPTITLDTNVTGVLADGSDQVMQNFLNNYDSSKTNKLQMEFLVVSPLEQVDAFNEKKIPISHLEYDLTYTDSTDEVIPEPFFLIQSDGYYRDFKQSITSIVTPKSETPLFDFTVIQQQ